MAETKLPNETMDLNPISQAILHTGLCSPGNKLYRRAREKIHSTTIKTTERYFVAFVLDTCLFKGKRCVVFLKDPRLYNMVARFT